MPKVALEKACKRTLAELPPEFQHLDIPDFGIEINLYKYQQIAIVNVFHFACSIRECCEAFREKTVLGTERACLPIRLISPQKGSP